MRNRLFLQQSRLPQTVEIDTLVLSIELRGHGVQEGQELADLDARKVAWTRGIGKFRFARPLGSLLRQGLDCGQMRAALAGKGSEMPCWEREKAFTPLVKCGSLKG
jgi:hypothetical protein